MDLITDSRSLIFSSIDEAITSNISLAFSSAEYFVIAFGHAVSSRLSFQPRGRLLIYFYVNILVLPAVGIVALTLLVLNVVLNFEVFFFQWVTIHVKLCSTI
jgi:hypothetical protein